MIFRAKLPRIEARFSGLKDICFLPLFERTALHWGQRKWYLCHGFSSVGGVQDTFAERMCTNTNILRENIYLWTINNRTDALVTLFDSVNTLSTSWLVSQQTFRYLCAAAAVGEHNLIASK